MAKHYRVRGSGRKTMGWVRGQGSYLVRVCVEQLQETWVFHAVFFPSVHTRVQEDGIRAHLLRGEVLVRLVRRNTVSRHCVGLEGPEPGFRGGGRGGGGGGGAGRGARRGARRE